jgi:hypothetical protein
MSQRLGVGRGRHQLVLSIRIPGGDPSSRTRRIAGWSQPRNRDIFPQLLPSCGFSSRASRPNQAEVRRRWFISNAIVSIISLDLVFLKIFSGFRLDCKLSWRTEEDFDLDPPPATRPPRSRLVFDSSDRSSSVFHFTTEWIGTNPVLSEGRLGPDRGLASKLRPDTSLFRSPNLNGPMKAVDLHLHRAPSIHTTMKINPSHPRRTPSFTLWVTARAGDRSGTSLPFRPASHARVGQASRLSSLPLWGWRNWLAIGDVMQPCER